MLGELVGRDKGHAEGLLEISRFELQDSLDIPWVVVMAQRMVAAVGLCRGRMEQSGVETENRAACLVLLYSPLDMYRPPHFPYQNASSDAHLPNQPHLDVLK